MSTLDCVQAHNLLCLPILNLAVINIDTTHSVQRFMVRLELLCKSNQAKTQLKACCTCSVNMLIIEFHQNNLLYIRAFIGPPPFPSRLGVWPVRVMQEILMWHIVRVL